MWRNQKTKSLTHNHLTQRGLTKLMMLDIFCGLLHSTSPIFATLPCDSETRPDKWKERIHSERKPSTHGDTGNESAMTVSTYHQVRPETLLPQKGTSRNLSSRESARFIATRKRRITAERYPQTPVSFVAHDLQDKDINSNLLSLFYLPIMYLMLGNGKRWSTQPQTLLPFWVGWLVVQCPSL